MLCHQIICELLESIIKPFLMFTGKAEEALTLYVENIPNSKILTIDRYGAGD